jgi:hypothetical protein
MTVKRQSSAVSFSTIFVKSDMELGRTFPADDNLAPQYATSV